MAELLVVGAGAMGASTAYWAARGGLDTRLIDAFGHPQPVSAPRSQDRSPVGVRPQVLGEF